MAETPTDRKYTESHEWFKPEGDLVVVGITKHAVDELTDVTFVEMKDAGESVEPGDAIGEVESVKATSDIYTALGGEIAEVNEKLGDDPSLLNTDPYGDGWLIKLKPSDTGPLDSLMDGATYGEKYA